MTTTKRTIEQLIKIAEDLGISEQIETAVEGLIEDERLKIEYKAYLKDTIRKAGNIRDLIYDIKGWDKSAPQSGAWLEAHADEYFRILELLEPFTS